jgi:hypothetical protein
MNHDATSWVMGGMNWTVPPPAPPRATSWEDAAAILGKIAAGDFQAAAAWLRQRGWDPGKLLASLPPGRRPASGERQHWEWTVRAGCLSEWLQAAARLEEAGTKAASAEAVMA